MTFNPEQLLATQTTAAGSTKVIPVPESEYMLKLGKPRFSQFEITKGDNAGKKLTKMTIMAVVDTAVHPEVKEVTKRDKPQVRIDFPVELTEDGMMLAEGEGINIMMGRLREACGMNQEGVPFSPSMFEDQIIVGKVSHTKPNDAGDVFAECKQFASPNAA